MSLRLGGALKELRIHLCQTSKQSQGVRDFIQKNYVNIKKENPNFPILIRECSGVQPRVWARYGRHDGCDCQGILFTGSRNGFWIVLCLTSGAIQSLCHS